MQRSAPKSAHVIRGLWLTERRCAFKPKKSLLMVPVWSVLARVGSAVSASRSFVLHFLARPGAAIRMRPE